MADILTLPQALPGHMRVSEAVRQAQAAGAGLWLTRGGRVVIHPHGRPGWRRLPYRAKADMSCAA